MRIIETPLHTRYTLWVEVWQHGQLIRLHGYPGVLWPYGDAKYHEVTP